MIPAIGLIAGVLALSPGDFSDNFESYVIDSKLHWNNGWHGWDNAVAAEGVIKTTFARGGSRSVDAGGTADVVQNFTATSGKWTLAAWQYIPTSATGSNTYFIIMNTYVDGGAKNWSTQVIFDFGTNKVYDNMGGATGSVALLRDAWVPIQVDIDLDAKTQTIYYNNTKVTTVGWNRLGGVAAIAALDLYGSTTNHVYYDDVTLTKVVTTVPVKVARWREVTPDE